VQFYWLIIGVLAVWRVSYLLTFEAGPGHVLARLRQRLERALSGEFVNCLYCVSVWIAAPCAFLLGESWKHRLLLWPALSAGAIILERALHGEALTPQYYEDRHYDDQYYEGQEDRHVLRQESKITPIQRS
jgi:Protein of unknown function (DUF1360)